MFLDRDGVLNEAVVIDGHPLPPDSVGDLVLTTGVEDACAALRRAGLLLIMVTNQPDIARGTRDRASVDAINQELVRRLGLDDVLVCPHDDRDSCGCRKPEPGLILEAATRWAVALRHSVVVGDRWRDIEAGRRAGCKTVLLARGYDERPAVGADLVMGTLHDAVPWIVANARLGVPIARELGVKIFADGADAEGIALLASDPTIKGFTTNPTLMRGAGVADYERFAHEVLSIVGHRPVSFEVFADDFEAMERQARLIATWGDSVYVKVPITNTVGESSQLLLRRLAADGIKVNVTALLTIDQVKTAAAALAGGPSSFISVFAGRIADTGQDPVPVMQAALEVMAPHTNLELIWASPREVLNVVQADAIGCHVITVTPDILKKLPLLGTDLAAYSLDTVRMFHRDAQAAGYTLADGQC